MCTEAKQLMGWTLGLLQQSEGINPPSNKFINICITKGGAEGWVQAELDQIYKTLPNTIWVQREQNIYNNSSEAVDFVIKCKNGPCTCVELKVESLFHSASLGRVTMPHKQWQSISDDIQKLKQKRNPTYSGEPAYAIAMVWSNEAISGIDGWLKTSDLTYIREAYPITSEEMQWTVVVYVISI